MRRTTELGRTYRCPVCGAEVTVLVKRHGDFIPRCCNRDMVVQKRRPTFLVCPVCGAQVAVWSAGGGKIVARCCNTAMRSAAA